MTSRTLQDAAEAVMKSADKFGQHVVDTCYPVNYAKAAAHEILNGEEVMGGLFAFEKLIERADRGLITEDLLDDSRKALAAINKLKESCK